MTDLPLIHDPQDIPTFETEAEEAEFWATHALGDSFFEGVKADDAAQAMLCALPKRRPKTDTGKSNPTSIRLGRDLEKRLRVLAERKGTNYQTLLKEFVLERVYEEEKRLKII